MKGKKQKEPAGMNPAEIFAALALLEKERGISQEVVLKKIVQAITTAYQRDHPDVEHVVVEMSRTPEGVLHVILHTENEQAARLLSEHSSTLGMMLQNSQQNEVRIEVQQPNQSEQPWQHPDQDGGQSGQDGRQQRERRQQTDPERFLQQLRLGLTGTDG